MVNENKIDIFIRIWWKGGSWISLVWVEELVRESLIGCMELRPIMLDVAIVEGAK